MPRTATRYLKSSAAPGKLPKESCPPILPRHDVSPWRACAPARPDFANPNLAATLQQIATGGRDEFYKGRIAAAIVADSKTTQSFLDGEISRNTSRDLGLEPISTTYRVNHNVYEMPPNTQGFLVLEMLNILEGFDIKSLGHNSAQDLTFSVEAKRIAFSDRPPRGRSRIRAIRNLNQ